MKILTSTRMLLAAVLAGGSIAPVARANTVTEPETVFYGRVINRVSGPVCVLTEGTLSWRVRRADGTRLTLTAPLQPLKDGAYSYRLNVPHQALGLGLSSSTTTVPLSAQPTTVVHEQITLDGYPATILAPGAASVTVSQAGRAQTVRLDLEVYNPLPDLDGDGIADWWQLRYLTGDPQADPDGDGRNNLAEFLNGTDPTRDDRNPSLATQELRAYADGTTAIFLRAVDSDTVPASLTYGLSPAGGRNILPGRCELGPTRPRASGGIGRRRKLPGGVARWNSQSPRNHRHCRRRLLSSDNRTRDRTSLGFDLHDAAFVPTDDRRLPG
jgi:hypothetical protein